MIKAILSHHNFIKITSCIIGYTLWAFLAQYQTMITKQQVPICFYATKPGYMIEAPDFINLALSHKRKHLYLLRQIDSAIHLDASHYGEGKHFLQISRENLFLPDHIKIEHLDPMYIEFTITKHMR